jgi:predicted nucleic acid-binding protein
MARINTTSGPVEVDGGKLALALKVLIALTARSHGARLFTTSRRDFELINPYRQINLAAQ